MNDKLERGQTYKVIRTSDLGGTFHRAQGRGFPKVGDVVRIGRAQYAIWKSGASEMCWAIEATSDAYGANFSADMLEPVDENNSISPDQVRMFQ